MKRELKEAFRFYDKEGKSIYVCWNWSIYFSNSYYVKTASRIYYLIGLGYLTIDTLKGILLELEPNLGDEQLMEIVEEVDEDGSGTIDFDGNILHNS